MTDIKTFLDSHAALLASRDLSFDQKVGYLVALALSSVGAETQIGDGTLLQITTNSIRNAMTERQSAELKARAAAMPPPLVLTPPPAPKPKRDIEKKIQAERNKVAAAVSRLTNAIGDEIRARALENLQLHTRRLQALERKRK